MNPDEENWVEKILISANSYWYLKQHKSAIRHLTIIFEKGELRPEAKILHQRKLEGWYLSERQLSDYRNLSEISYDKDETADSLFYLNRAIYEVLSRNRDGAKSAFDHLQDHPIDAFSKSNEMIRLKNELNTLRSAKSRLLGGSLSAVVPGSGSLYANRPWDALYSLILTSGFAALTGESIVNNGFRHPSTIILGGIGFSFYIGNIYGGYRRVTEYNESLFYELDDISDHILDQYYSPE